MSTDLHTRLLVEIDRWGCENGRCVHRPPSQRCSRAALAGALRGVVELCSVRQAETVDGDATDVDTLWPSEVIDVITRELAVTDG